jgi:ferredoxin
MPNITHYRDKCIGCGVCYEMMPEIWRMSTKDGKATLVQALLKRKTFVLTVGPALFDASKDVAAACPVKIIKVNQ